LSDSFFFIFIKTKSLPLRVYAMDRPARENTSLNHKSPISWIFRSAAWVVLYNIKYLNYFSKAKFSSWKRYLLESFCHSCFQIRLTVQQSLSCNWFCNPVTTKHQSFWVVTHHALLVEVFLLWVNLIATAFCYVNY